MIDPSTPQSWITFHTSIWDTLYITVNVVTLFKKWWLSAINVPELLTPFFHYMWYMHTWKPWNNEIERTVFELSFGLFDWSNYSFFCKITRNKRKKFKEMRGIEPRSAGCEFRVLTITPSKPLLERDPILKMVQYLPKFHYKRL